jgi:hypothetical protein
MILAVQSIGGVSAASAIAPTGAKAPAEATRRAEADNKDSTIVISRVTRSKADGATVTTITYADGHTRIETTPAKYSATEGQATEANGIAGGDRVTAVDILA